MLRYPSIQEFQCYWLDETKDKIMEICREKRREENTQAHEMAARLGLPIEKYLKVERFPRKYSLDFLLYFATWFDFNPYLELIPNGSEEDDE